MRILLNAIVGLIFIVQVTPAQTLVSANDHTAKVVVKVSDQSGAPVPNARVGLFSAADKTLLTKLTDTQGTIAFGAFKGEFTLEVSYPGFVSAEQTLTVGNQPEQTVPVILKIGHGSGPEVTAVPRPGKSTGKSNDIWPTVISAEIPLYPPLARAARIEGTVQLEASTDGFGVEEVKASGAHRLLLETAERNLRTWHFIPHEPGRFFLTYTYRFTKRGESPAVRMIFDRPIHVEVSGNQPSIDQTVSY